MARTRKSKVKGPQQVMPLGRSLIVLRKIDQRKLGADKKARAKFLERLALTQLEPDVPEAEMAWFSQGYIANDQPRDSISQQVVMNATIPNAFAIATTEDGEILKSGLSLVEAEELMTRAVARPISIDFDLDDEDEDDEEEVEDFDQDVDDDEDEGEATPAPENPETE